MFLKKRENCEKRRSTSNDFSLVESQTIDRNGEIYQKNRKIFNFSDIYRRAKDLEKRKDGLSNFEIEKCLSPIPNFQGVIFDDNLNQLHTRRSGFVVINLDHSQRPGTHWIALGIFKNTVEFFDPLGCDFLNWPNLPIGLLKFLFDISFEKTVVRINRLQSSKSAVCGLYCIFYIIHRRKFSLQTILNYFNGTRSENDRKLVRYFK